MSLTLVRLRREIYNAYRTENVNQLIDILHSEEARNLMQEEDIRHFYVGIIQSKCCNSFTEKLERMNIEGIFIQYFPNYVHNGNFCTPEEKMCKILKIIKQKPIEKHNSSVGLSQFFGFLSVSYLLIRIGKWVQNR